MSQRPVRNRTDFIVWHCSATKPSWNGGAADIDGWHKKNGWKGIGYHFVIRRNGLIEVGEALNHVGAHVQGFNSASVGICLVGGVAESGKSENNFTPEQWKSAALLHELLSRVYPKATHTGHRDLSPDKNGDGVVKRDEWLKDCPCFSVADWEAGGLKPLISFENTAPVQVPRKKN